MGRPGSPTWGAPGLCINKTLPTRAPYLRITWGPTYRQMPPPEPHPPAHTHMYKMYNVYMII